MKLARLLVFLVLSGLSGLALAACSSGGSSDSLDITPTPTLAIVTKDNYSLEPVRACTVEDFAPIQTDKSQGTLVSWSPSGHKLAYVAPLNRDWGWYEGDLVIYDLDTQQEQATRDIQVAGDITWSPDGAHIAFIALHTPENKYTVMVMDLAEGTTVDLYPNLPSTDSFDSLKGIDGWSGNSLLDVSEVCGVDCVDIVEHNLTTGQGQTLREIRRGDDTSLDLITNQDISSVDENWLLANWSPDEKWVFFTDSRDVAWLAQPQQQLKFPIDIGDDKAVETSWSADSQYVAVRTASHIFVFRAGCTP
jgi:hypothetical protein